MLRVIAAAVTSQFAHAPPAAAEADAAQRAAALEAATSRWSQRRASRRRDADDAAAGATQAAERTAAFVQAAAERHARRLERRASRRRGADEAAAAERAADEAGAARLRQLLEVAAAVRAADEAEAAQRAAALAQVAAEGRERRLQRRERLQRRVARRREALEAAAADEAGAAQRAAAAAQAAADKRDRRLERRAVRRREREEALAAERVADEADAAQRRAATERAAAALRALEEANAGMAAALERSRLLREEHAERARRQEAADAAAARRAAVAAEAAAAAAAAEAEGAVAADIAELLRRLELSQHGAALTDRLGVRSVADLSNVTDAVLRDALPELQSAERDALLVAVRVAMWAAGVAQPPDTPPVAAVIEARPDADEAWEADWTMLDRLVDAAPEGAEAVPEDEALRPQTPAPLQPAGSADPCVKCRRFKRLAVNTPCGHAFMCRHCTADFRGGNGPICNQCRQPSTVSDAAHNLTCCICQDDFTRTADMFCFEPCGHMTCLKCAVELVRAALGDADGKFPFRCELCRIDALERRAQPPAPVPGDDLLRRLLMLRSEFEALGLAPLNDDEMARFRRFNAVSLVPANRRVYCPAPACGAMMVVEPDAVARTRAAGGATKRCPACPTAFCLGCSATPFHIGASCEAHAAHLARHAGTDTDTAAFIQQTTRPCPGCGLRVTHYRGHACHHMSPGRGCPQCGTHWCFRCGEAAPIPPHRCETPACQGHLFCDDTCTCPDCPVCKPGQPCTGAAGCDHDGRCRSCRPL